MLGLFEFIRELGNTTEESWYYWPLIISAMFAWCSGLAVFCGAMGWCFKFIYKRNKYIPLLIIIALISILSLWLSYQNNVVSTLSMAIGKISFWVILPLGVLACIGIGIDSIRRLVIRVFEKREISQE